MLLLSLLPLLSTQKNNLGLRLNSLNSILSLSLSLGLSLSLIHPTWAAANRCINPTGTVVAYADTSTACPLGSQLNGEVAAAPALNPHDVRAAKASALQDIQAVKQLEQREANENLNMMQAQAAAIQYQAKQDKRCKAANLTFDRVKLSLEHPKHPTHKNKKTKQNANDDVLQLAHAKAKLRLEAAQAKRDAACHS